VLDSLITTGYAIILAVTTPMTSEISLDEQGAATLRDLLTEWLG
jgi:hypothetical protein